MNDAIGLIETKGVLALVSASDAMAKAADVEIVKRIQIGGGFMTTIVRGDVGSVRAAVDAGAAAAESKRLPLDVIRFERVKAFFFRRFELLIGALSVVF